MNTSQLAEFAITTCNLTRRFDKDTAVHHLNLAIPTHNIYGFLGPNGCGKSTILRMLTGLLTPSGGEVSVLGFELPRQAESLRQHIGYMTQKFSLYDDLRLEENLRFTGQIYGLDHRTLQSRISEQLATYNLRPYLQYMAGHLSGGLKQRLALAVATFHRPKLLFLDEPTSAVDPENRRDFWEKLFDLCDQGTTILVSTHYMDEAERCHKLAILNHGKKIADGSPAQLMKDMQADVVEIEGSRLRALKTELLKLPRILAAAQLGIRLRVLVQQGSENSQAYLQQKIGKTYADHSLSITHPSLEDVFVHCTRNSTI